MLCHRSALTKPPIDMLQTGSLRTVEIFVQASIDLPKEGDDNSETIPARFRPHQFHAQAVNEGWAVRRTLSAVFPLLIVISLLEHLHSYLSFPLFCEYHSVYPYTCAPSGTRSRGMPSLCHQGSHSRAQPGRSGGAACCILHMIGVAGGRGALRSRRACTPGSRTC